MTDLELFLAFYTQIGIDMHPRENYQNDDNIIYRFGDDYFGDNDVTPSKLFNGYFGFYSDIEFTKEGKFVRQGFWE